jgi:hypothetical protein
MSGSGGGGYSPRESGCGNFSFSTVLGSPKSTVLALLRKGQILDLVLKKTLTKIVVATTTARLNCLKKLTPNRSAQQSLG